MREALYPHFPNPVLLLQDRGIFFMYQLLTVVLRKSMNEVKF